MSPLLVQFHKRQSWKSQQTMEVQLWNRWILILEWKI